MKKISILIPCYNEEENVGPISEEIVKPWNGICRAMIMSWYLLIMIHLIIRGRFFGRLCSENRRIKAIFNAKEFRPV